MKKKTITGVRPEVGMGATMILGSDAHPYTIIWVSDSRRRIKIQPDYYDLIEGNRHTSEYQVYRYTRNRFAPSKTVSFRKNGSWRVSNEGTPVGIGYRREYRDPSF